jgi:hypothetical protein
LESKEIACGVRLQRRGQIEQPAQVIKVGLVGGGFLRTNLCPFCFEFSRGHIAARASAGDGNDYKALSGRKQAEGFIL